MTITAKRLDEMTYNMYNNSTKCHKFQVRIWDGSDDMFQNSSYIKKIADSKL